MAKFAELISNNNEILYPTTVASQVLTNEVIGERLPQVLDRIDRDISSVTNEVVNARTDNKTPSTTHPNLKARLDDLDGRLTALDITAGGNTNEIANIITNLNAFNKEVEQARTDNQNPAHTYNSLKQRLDADVKRTNEEIEKINVEIEKTNTQLSEIKTVITYEMFGAIGDGATDDFEAIKKTHEFANLHNFTVEGNSKANYYVKNINTEIPIKTNVNWNGCKFTIDDSNLDGSIDVGLNLFKVVRTEPSITISNFGELKKSQRSLKTDIINQLKDKECIIYVEDSSQKIYKRKGVNGDEGINLCDIFRVTSNGLVLDDILYDFSINTIATAYPIEKEVIVLKNVTFNTICNKTPSHYLYHHRGIRVERDNVHIKELNHFINDEPIPHNQRTSSPYWGFITVYKCCDFLLQDSNIQGHRMYLSTNPDTEIQMGSYDLRLDYVIEPQIVNVKQINGIRKSLYTIWGIQTSNGSKNAYFKRCSFNRIDAHRGIHNLTVKQCELGANSLTLIGSGKLLVEDTDFVGTTRLVNLREDYGSHWEGDLIFNRCKLTPPHTYSEDFTLVRAENDGTHNFGYKCKFPNIYIDKLIVDDLHWETNLNPNHRGYCVFDNRVDCGESNKFNPIFPDFISIKNSYCTSEFGGYTLFKYLTNQFTNNPCKTIQIGDLSSNLKNRTLVKPNIITNVKCVIDNVKLALRNKKVDNFDNLSFNNFLYQNLTTIDDFPTLLTKYGQRDAVGNYRVLPNVEVRNCDNVMAFMYASPAYVKFVNSTIIRSQQGKNGSHSYFEFINCNFNLEKMIKYFEKVYNGALTLNLLEQITIFNLPPGGQEYHNCYFSDFGEYEDKFVIPQSVYEKNHSITTHLKFNNNTSKTVFRNASYKFGCKYSDKITFDGITGGDIEAFMNKYNLRSLYNFDGTIVHFRCYGTGGERPPREFLYNGEAIPLPVGFRYFNTDTKSFTTWTGGEWV